MDPAECVKMLMGALEEGDRDGSVEHLESLLGWLRKGGFMPDVSGMMRSVPAAWKVRGGVWEREDVIRKLEGALGLEADWSSMSVDELCIILEWMEDHS